MFQDAFVKAVQDDFEYHPDFPSHSFANSAMNESDYNSEMILKYRRDKEVPSRCW